MNSKKIKTIVFFFMIISINVLLISCKKDEKICAEPKEIINNKNHLFDLTELKETAFFNDTLNKYPFLQAIGLNRNDAITVVFCNVYFDNLLVFDVEYAFNNVHKFNYHYQNFDLNTLNIKPNTTIPAISANKAIEIAKKVQGFDNICIAYQLGLQYVHDEFRLCWKITNIENNCFFVKVDATNGNILGHFNCIYY